MVMPVGRYIAWVGASLLALLFIVNWCLPAALPQATADPIEKPVIRIASAQQPLEHVVIDTSLPTIVPPPTPVESTPVTEPIPVQAEVQAPAQASAPPLPTAIDIDRKTTERKTAKANKRQAPKVATTKPKSTPAPTVASASPATTAPHTKLSFADIISGQFVKNLFNVR